MIFQTADPFPLELLLSYVGISVILDRIAPPITAKVSDSKHYLRSSVDECKSKIRSIGFVIDTGLSGITCNLKESPKIIQIDETGLIQLLFLG